MFEKIKYKDLKEWLVAVLFFLSTNPYFLWGTGISNLVSIAIVILVIFNLQKRINVIEFIALCIISLFYTAIGIRHSGTMLGMVYILIIPIYFFIDRNLFRNSYKKFIIILSAVTTLSIVSYFLIVFFKVPLSYSEIEPLNPIKDFTYLKYPFLVMENRDIGLDITRLYGVYDEPGVLGSLAAVILCKEHFNFKKSELIPLFIGGLLTFSLYFYVILLIYVLLFTKIKTVVAICLCMAVLIPILLQIEDLKILIFNRFIIENGVWKGNSRYSMAFLDWYDKFRHTPMYFIGMGTGYNLVVNYGGASYRDIIVNYGIILFCCYLFGYFLLSLRRHFKFKEFVLSVVLIATFIYQRPFIFDISILYTFLYVATYNFINNLDYGDGSIR